MDTPSRVADGTEAGRDPARWHLLLIGVVSAGYESLFLYIEPNWLDEGWPLYAAQRLWAGGSLYRDVFFVFPPGHLLSAWLAYGWDPPGILGARLIYAAFNVALCLVLYRLGRRLMPAPFALLAVLMLALAAPGSHEKQLLFGYRYLVFSAIALLAFARRLSSGDRRWMLAAGIFSGIALCFRITPAFSVGIALGVASMAADRDWRSWLRDWSWLAAGALASAAPAVAWLASDVGLEAVWREVVVRPVVMTRLQGLPLPGLALPEAWGRAEIASWFVAFQFRAYLIFYTGYGIALAALWARSLLARRRFEHALLLAVALWGGSYYLRSLGRSDEPHLASAIPPLCLLLAHLLSLVFRAAWRARRGRPALARPAACLAALLVWVLLWGSDLSLAPLLRELWPQAPTHWGRPTSWSEERDFFLTGRDEVRSERRRADPDDIVLDLSASPLLYVVKGRMGPGYFDVIMPGTFLSESEERGFVGRLERAPPSGIFWPEAPFDDMPSRSLDVTAPLVVKWAREISPERGEYDLPRAGPAVR